MQNGVLEALAGAVWGIIPSAAVLAAGLAICFKLRFRQLTGLRRLGAAMRGSGQKLSAFEMFSLTAGGKMGVGNIVGVSVALAAGGAGSIFWMGVYAVIGAGVSYCECRLGARLGGGPTVYMKKLRGFGGAAGIFGLLLFANQAIMMPAIQVNTASEELKSLVGGSPAAGIIAAAVCAAVFLIFSLRGEKATAALGAKVMPFAAAVYMLLAVAVIIANIARLPSALADIFIGAFEPRSATGGLLGALTVGLRRSMFTGEAGYGIAPYAAAKAEGTPDGIGLVQGFSVIFDTLIMCSLTALMLLCSGADSPARAAEMLLGAAGRYIVAALVLLFAFTTLLCCGFTAAAPFKGAGKAIVLLITAGSCVAASAAAPQEVWALGDICGAFMAWLNIAALLAYEFGAKNKTPEQVRGFKRVVIKGKSD